MSLSLILRPRIRVLLFAFISTVSLVFALLITKEVGSAAGNTITVNSTSDVANTADGVCTLREAIIAANSNTASGVVAGECAAGSSDGSDTIDLTGLTGSITLTSALPNISSDATVNGPGTSNLTIQRSSSNFSIFSVDSIATVNISGFTIQGGTPEFHSSGVANTGNGTLNLSNCAVSGFDRGVFNSSQRTLTMTNCVVNANRGGVVSFAGTVNVVNSTISGSTDDGIGNSFATLNVTRSTITGNTGGIGNGLATNATIIDSTVSNNTERGVLNNGNLTMIGGSITGNANGGAFLAGTSVLNGVTVSGNSNVGGTGHGGGGIFVSGDGPSTIINCLVTNNSTSGNGGGIRNGGGKATIVNTTISGNTSNGVGGGIATVDGGLATFIAINLTITGNRSNSGGGGVFRESGPMKFRNSLIAGNFQLNGTTPSDIGSTVDASSSFNLIGVGGSGGLTNGVNNNLVGVADPGLGPLANNGGPTLTHSLLSNSPALDTGDNCLTEVTHCGETNVPQITTDQRGPGFHRIVDGPDADTTATVDVGAYETQLPLASLPNMATNEDTQLIVAFDVGDTSTITSITATSSNPTLVPNDVAHLSVVLAGTTGVITVNPAANLFGSTDLTITVNRTGGQDVKTFMLTVNSSNDAPSFTKGSDQTVNEDAGPQTIGNWATNLSPGPADEAGQTLTLQVTANTNAALFSSGPAISSTGTLTYTPAANANGVATVTIVLKDTGGTDNGGVDTSPAQTFVITINSVNDAPSFTKGPDQTVNEDAGTSFASWATNVSTGATNELQALTFEVTNNTNPTLFLTGPVINLTGALSFTPAPNMNGSATITIRLKDNGGTANGGVDSSSSQTFTVTVLPVNDPPTITRGPSPVVNEDAGPQSLANWATNISPGPADEAGQTISISVQNNNNALFSTQPTISADGTLTFTPAANANGFATVTVILQDNGGTASGGLDIFARNFSISVIAVNDPPVNTVPGAQGVVKNTLLIFSATNSNQISIHDVDAGNAAVQVTLTTSNGVLTLSGTTGLTFSVGTGAANSNMTFTGTISNINAALNGMSFAPTNNFEGIAELQISTSDLGNSGGGGVQSDTDTVNISVVESTVQFSASAYMVVEGSELVTITVMRIAGSGAASVNYSTSDGSASGGASCAASIDYVSQSGTLLWTAGETTAKTFTVRICEDAANEPDESVNLTLSGVTGNTFLGAPQIAVLTIVNASPPVLLTEENTDHAIALDSVTLERDPFSQTHPVAFGTDNRRRISLFIWRLAIRPTDTPSALTVVAEDNEGRVYPLTVEFVGPISGPPLVNQVVVRLPDDVVGAPRNLFITVQLRGSATNQAFIKIAGP